MQTFVRWGRHHTVRGRIARVPFHDAVNRKRAAQWTAAVKASDQRDDVVQSGGERCGLEVVAIDELGDERADSVQHAEHRRPDAELGCTRRRVGLEGPVDTE
jgi:hypothetical protein